jgi:CheY-like chemotaxis protein
MAKRASARVLIAEDHPDSRDALRTLLEALGYDVSVARNGREAIDLALALRPDLILMDVMMPEVDGLQATRTLRNHEGFEEVPIIAVTAMEGAREQSRAAGCDDYVAKPINIRKLIQDLDAWLGEESRNGHSPI